MAARCLVGLAVVCACGRTPEGGTIRPATRQGSASPTAAAPDFRAPRRIKDVRPVYPEALAGSGRGGDVVLELRIDLTGKVTGVEVKQSLGAEFDEAAVTAARQWEYTPTIFNGEPALMYLTVTVPFAPPA